MIKSTFLCTLLLCSFFMARSQNYNGLKHASGNRWDNDYSLEVFYTSNDYYFKKVPDMPNNPFPTIPGGNKDFGAYGMGAAFSKTLTSKARIEISPSIYLTNNQQQYYASYATISNSSSQQRMYDLHGFSIPVSYISYFKIPRKRVSWYWSANTEYTSLKLTTHDSYAQAGSSGNSASYQTNTYNEKNISLLAGIGLDCKLNPRWYLFYDMRFGATLIDPGFLMDGRLGARVNFFKKQ